MRRTPGRNKRKSRGLHGVREAARKDGSLKFTALLHHVNEGCLTEAFFSLKKTAAVGVDEVTWHDYERNLEINIADLHGRIHRGAYRAQPSRRVWIPKPDGRKRPLGIGFEHQKEAVACLEELHTRFAKFGLKLHEGKTRLIEFGRHAAEHRKRRGEGRPETFDFLGFTHVCARTRAHGRFAIHRYSASKRLHATLRAVQEQLRRRMHRPVGETGRWLRRVVQGWLNYHAVPFNMPRLDRFVQEVIRRWPCVLCRRSQRGRSRWTWERMYRLAKRHIPNPKILHPYPHQRFRARLKVGAV